MSTRTGFSRVTIVLAAAAACENPQPPTAPSRLIGLAVAGTNALNDLGAITRLTATARFSDDSERDVSAEAAWSSSDSRVVSAAPGGVITAIGFGTATIEAAFQRRASIQVFVVPAGTSCSAGLVTERGGSPIAGVRVVDADRGLLATTNSPGWYFASGVSGSSLLFEHDLYESAARTIVPNALNHVVMQTLIRITAGATMTDELMPVDVEYELGDGIRCDPCRLIRIECPSAGTLELQLSWTQTEPMALSTAGQLFAGGQGGIVRALVPVAAGELVAYVGHVPPRAIGWELADFSLMTRLIPGSTGAADASRRP